MNFLRRSEVIKRTGLSRSNLDRKIRAGQFPAGFPLSEGGRTLGWDEAAVVEWMAKRTTDATSEQLKAQLDAARAERDRKRTSGSTKRDAPVTDDDLVLTHSIASGVEAA